jgi:hypothetical protein
MKQARRQTQERNRRQKQVRARLRTEQMRQGYDDVDLPYEPLPLPGRLPDDGDLERGRFAADTPPSTSAMEGWTLRDLLLSRPPRVHFRLVDAAGVLEVVATTRPRSAAARGALEEIADFLRFIFKERRPAFADAEWAGLLHGTNVTTAERLILLARLALAADTRIAARVPFTPNDRGLKRFYAKFAVLPDGTPFSLRLLLRDLRGRRRSRDSSPSGILELPEALVLLAVRRVLAREAEEKQARSDYEIGPQLRRALEEMGIRLKSAPSEEEVRTLRERRAWKRLGLLPKAAQRRRGYAAEAQQA